MLPVELYQGIESAWCPGCGNFPMLKAFKQALAELEIRPEALLIVSGIGQSGKFPQQTAQFSRGPPHVVTPRGKSRPVAGASIHGPGGGSAPCATAA